MSHDYPNAPGWRRGAPATSREAANSMCTESVRLRDECYRRLLQQPATADEVAHALGRSVLSVRPRFSELRALGLIEDSGERRRLQSGRRGVVWRACDASRQLVLIPDAGGGP